MIQRELEHYPKLCPFTEFVRESDYAEVRDDGTRKALFTAGREFRDSGFWCKIPQGKHNGLIVKAKGLGRLKNIKVMSGIIVTGECP